MKKIIKNIPWLVILLILELLLLTYLTLKL